MDLILHVDGGSRGNPGPAGAGVVLLQDSGGRVHLAGYFLGTQTNNAAEYYGLIRGLQRAAKANPDTLGIFADSELLVRQITGEYRVKSPALAQLYEQVQMLLLKIKRWSIQHVRREGNAEADRLANLAMDHRADVIEFDIDDSQVRTMKKPSEPRAPQAPVLEAKTEGATKPALLSACDNGVRRVRVSATTPPQPATCPAENWFREPLAISAKLSADMCVFAAHSLLPTILAAQYTDAGEFASLPTMTVRCGRQGCNATFTVAPELSKNGTSK